MTATISKPTTNARRSRRPVHLPAVMGLRKDSPITPVDHGDPCADCNGAEFNRARLILEEVELQIDSRLVNVLKAIRLMLESQRVLTELADAARHDEGLELVLRNSVEAWREPVHLNEQDGHSALASLTQLAESMASGMVMDATEAVLRREMPKADASA